MSVDTSEIYKLPIKDVAKSLGIEVIGNRGRCFNTAGHQNGDRNPSLIFGVNSNAWKCPVCNFDFQHPSGAGYGSAIDLVMLYYGIDFKEALNWFVDRYHVNNKASGVAYKPLKSVKGISDRGISGQNRIKNTAGSGKTVNTVEISNKNIEIYGTFVEHLGNISPIGKQYLNSRGISDFLISEYKLTDIKDNDKTAEYLKTKFNMDDLLSSGLFRISGKTKKPYFALFSHRLIFPFYRDNSVVYIQGRDITSNAKTKYYNSGTEIPCPYNVNLIRNNPDIRGEQVYITEGIIDCLSLMELGYNAVGVVGIGGFKKDWVSMFKDIRVYLAFDNESSEALREAVRKSVRNIVNMFAEVSGQRIGFITPLDLKDCRDCKDWNDVLLQKRKAEAEKKLINKN
jgi:hypothetical protein